MTMNKRPRTKVTLAEEAQPKGEPLPGGCRATRQVPPQPLHRPGGVAFRNGDSEMRCDSSSALQDCICRESACVVRKPVNELRMSRCRDSSWRRCSAAVALATACRGLSRSTNELCDCSDNAATVANEVVARRQERGGPPLTPLLAHSTVLPTPPTGPTVKLFRCRSRLLDDALDHGILGDLALPAAVGPEDHADQHQDGKRAQRDQLEAHPRQARV